MSTCIFVLLIFKRCSKMCKKIAVIIVTYNGIKWIERCLGSLVESHCPSEVFIVDNGSTDGTVEFIENNYSSYHLIKSEENLGFGRANNLAIRKAYESGFEYFFLLNQDAWVEKDAFGVLVDLMEQNPTYGVVSPLQFNGEGVAFDRNFCKLLNANNCPGFIEDSYFGRLQPLYNVKFVMAALWMVRRSTIERIGLFNPVFPHYGEDDDYLNRMIYHKINIGIATAAKGYHDREFRGVSYRKSIYFKYKDFLVGMNNLNRPYSVFFIKALLTAFISMLYHLLNGRFSHVKIECSSFFDLIVRKVFKSIKARKENRKLGIGSEKLREL